ncbi:uncharacterized protein LOC128736467 [Sabethes cyaneus]|uniref:uncharacterized protein LOC128736467 n=1 Tax=Sabethes cyaneus TaxID=53552 RepID=UPI00237DE7D9|nr:uncharacterized protein LOC128736467 [Sabethes cyaneus]
MKLQPDVVQDLISGVERKVRVEHSVMILSIVVLLITIVEGTLPRPNFYNLDLENHEYFKYPGRLTKYGLRPGNTDPSFAQRAKAVYGYFRNVLLGHPIQKNTYNIPVDPKRGLQLRAAYQRQFGYRGQNLVALIGNGHTPQELRYYGAIGRDFGY